MTVSTTINTSHQVSPEEAQRQAEHEAAMAAKGAAGGTVTINGRNEVGEQTTEVIGGDGPQKPEGVPDKFWDAEKGEVRVDALLQSYTELEKRQSAPKPDESNTDPTIPGKEDNAGGDGDEGTPGGVTQAVFDKATAEIEADGKLSDETYTELEKQGISRQMVDQYIAGAEAQATQVAQAAHSLVGGEQSYANMIEWAASNLSEAEIAAFNDDVVNPARQDAAVKGLHARFQAANGFEPSRTLNTTKPAAAGERFNSRHEMMAAMSDPRYKQGDTAFHAEVQRKIENATKANISLF